MVYHKGHKGHEESLGITLSHCPFFVLFVSFVVKI